VIIAPRTRSTRTSLRLFASARGATRSRRISDLVELTGAVIGLVLLGFLAVPPRWWDATLANVAASSPRWLASTWIAAYCLALLPSAVIALAGAVRRRWHVVLQAVVAAAAAYVLAIATARAFGATGPGTASLFPSGVGVWPAVTLSVTGAASVATWPEVVLPVRRIGVYALATAAIMAVLAGRATPTAAIGSLLVAAAAATFARFVVGTGAGRLEVADVRTLTGLLGLPIDAETEAERRPDGELLLSARDAAGAPVVVKLYGRDAVESRFAARAWRAVWYRDATSPLALTRAAGVQEEALATLLAASRGAAVWEVAAMGKPDGSADVLVLHAPGTRLTDLPDDAEDLVDRCWTALDRLHAAGFAHMALAPRSLVRLPSGEIAVTDLADAIAVPTAEQRSIDAAQLLVTLATLRGIETALARSAPAIGAERLAAIVPFLQPAALSNELRRAARSSGLDIEALHDAVVAATDIEPPQLARLRRVSWSGLIRMALLLFAAYAILPRLIDLDVAALRESLSSANGLLLAVAFVIAQTPRLGQAMSTLGSVPARLPFGPVYAMQLATSFMNLALPSAAARMALSVRFFQRQGVAPGTALASGLIDSLVGNVMQAGLLGLLVLLSPGVLDEVPAGDSGGPSFSHSLVFALLAVVVVVLVAVAAIGRLRRAVVERLRAWWPDIRASLQPLRDRHKLAQLLGGTLAAELLFAAALATCAHALGASDVSLIDALLVNLAASMITLVVPVPGGIGVAEAALILGLGLVGVDEPTAFGIAITYRAFTFYLPPIWGWFAMRWLETNRYL
jgi:uncharacterized membrane protein YbhN (UPF0104 family)